jgi:transcription initiation factor IIE alpha subunit
METIVMSEKNVVCDVCSAVFDMNTVAIQKEQLTNDRIGLYFVCPACGAKFPFAGITKNGIQLQKELQTISKKIDKAKDEKTKMVYWRRYQALLDVYSKEISGPYKEEEVVQ